MTKKKLTDNDVVTLLNPETFQASGSGNETGDPLGKTRIPVTIDQLIPSDLNPRQTRNPKYDEIKESIRNRGLDQPPKITRRSPDDPHFMIKDGGNTRLEILRELWEETGDERFYRIECDFEPWGGDIRELAGNISENENRGELLFIEKASAAMKLRRLFEEEEGNPISGRELARKITESGWSMNSGNLSRYEYAANSLLPLIPTALWAGAGHSAVTRLRKLESAYRKYWQHQESGRQNPEGFDLIWREVLSEHDAEILDFEAIQRALDIAVGGALQIHYQTVAIECDALASGIPLGAAGDAKGASPDLPTTPAPSDAPAAGGTGATAGHLQDEPIVSHGTAPGTVPGMAPEHPAAARPADRLEQLRQRASQTATAGGAAPPEPEPALPELRRRAFELAQRLAADWEIDDMIEQIDFGAGFKFNPPDRFLDDQTPQGGTFNTLYRLSLTALVAAGEHKKVMEPEHMLKLVFEDPFFATFADIACTRHILAINPRLDNKKRTRLLNLRHGFRELEDLVVTISDKIMQEQLSRG